MMPDSTQKAYNTYSKRLNLDNTALCMIFSLVTKIMSQRLNKLTRRWIEPTPSTVAQLGEVSTLNCAKLHDCPARPKISNIVIWVKKKTSCNFPAMRSA